MDDEKIISLYWKRDERAVEETQNKYGGLLFSVAFGILQNREDSEECVNDTYVRLWQAIPPEEPDNFPGYVCCIVRNLAIDRVKLYAADKRRGLKVAADELAACLPEAGDAVTDRMAMTKAFERFLASESPTNRMIFMRRYFYLDSTSDVARTMKMTDVSVRVSLYRIRRRLRRFLEEEGITL